VIESSLRVIFTAQGVIPQEIIPQVDYLVVSIPVNKNCGIWDLIGGLETMDSCDLDLEV